MDYDIEEILDDMNLHDLIALLRHNEGVVKTAENMLNGFLDANTDNHKTYLYIKNPDGTSILLQPGFEIKHCEIVGAKQQNRGGD